MQAEAEQQPQETYEVEQWLVDFANLFRDALGVEPDKHLDLTNFGWEKLQSALDSAVLSDEAPKLFDKAADRFQEVTAHGDSHARQLMTHTCGMIVLLLPDKNASKNSEGHGIGADWAGDSGYLSSYRS